MKEAGYLDAFEYSEIQFNNLTYPESPEAVLAGEAVAGYWQAVGLQVKIIPGDYATFRVKVLPHELGPYVIDSRPVSNKRAIEGAIRFYFHSDGAATFVKDTRPDLDAL